VAAARGDVEGHRGNGARRVRPALEQRERHGCRAAVDGEQIARVSDPVVLAVLLIGIRDSRAVVADVGPAVAVGVRAARYGGSGAAGGLEADRLTVGAGLAPSSVTAVSAATSLAASTEAAPASRDGRTTE